MDRSKLKVRYKRKQGKSPSGRVRSLPWLPILSFLGPGLPLLALGSAKWREPFTKRFQAGRFTGVVLEVVLGNVESLRVL